MVHDWNSKRLWYKMIKMITWWFMIGTPNVFRSMAYFVASSRARWARPTAPDATGGRVWKTKTNSKTRLLKWERFVFTQYLKYLEASKKTIKLNQPNRTWHSSRITLFDQISGQGEKLCSFVMLFGKQIKAWWPSSLKGLSTSLQIE